MELLKWERESKRERGEREKTMPDYRRQCGIVLELPQVSGIWLGAHSFILSSSLISLYNRFFYQKRGPVQSRAIYKWDKRGVHWEVPLRKEFWKSEINIGHGEVGMITEQIYCKILVINICLQKMCIIYISNKKFQRYPVLSKNTLYVENLQWMEL